MPKTIDVTELILRDAHQSLMATRMAMEDMIPACADLDQAGYWSVECWGGATFDSCIRFLNEDPWERLRQFRKLLPNTPAADAAARPEPARLPPLRRYGGGPLRRQGGRERHGRLPRVRRAQRHPQSAARRLRPCGAPESTRRAPSATRSARCTPPATSWRWRRSCSSWAAIPSASRTWRRCSSRKPAYDIVKGIKEACGEDVRVHVHVHATTGRHAGQPDEGHRSRARIASIRRSVRSASGPGHNPTESLVEMLEGTGFDTRLDKPRLIKLKKYFAGIRPRYKEFLSNITGVETEIFDSQIPGGMISNMESQLKQQGAGDRMEEVLLEVPQGPRGRRLSRRWSRPPARSSARRPSST